ncbi:MAG: ABC transporter ATP-binding protein [Pyrodictiaceae archaeon]
MELRVERLSVAYNGALVLNEISFSVKRGEVLGVLGPNGSGKTTLLKTIAGTLRAKEGAIYIDGHDLLRMMARERARLVAVIPASPPTSNLSSCVMDFLLTARYPYQNPLSPKIGDEDLEEIDKVSEELKLKELLERRMDQLSSGELQRTLIAHALVKNAKILLADEPTAFLDLNHKLHVFSLLRRIAREKEIIVVIATHELLIAPRYLDKVILLKNGVVRGYGPTWEALTPETIRDVFGVDVEITGSGDKRAIIVK